MKEKESNCCTECEFSFSEITENEDFLCTMINSDVDIPYTIHFIDYWKGFFDFGYYTLIIPFRLVRNSETNRYEIYKSSSQRVCYKLVGYLNNCQLCINKIEHFQVLCGIVQLILLFDFVSLFWTTYLDASEDSNISYFTSLTYIGYVAYNLSLNYTLWFRRDTFERVFEQLQNLKFYSKFSTRLSKIFVSNI